MFDKGAEQSAVGVAVHADPGALARTGEEFRPGMPVWQFHVHELRADTPALSLGGPCAGGAEGRVEEPAGSAGRGIKPGGRSRGEDDLFRADNRVGRFLAAHIQSERSCDAVFVTKQIQHRVMVEYMGSGLSGLRGQYLFLVVAVVFEENARTSGEGVPHEDVVVTERLHVDAPFMPFVGNADGTFQKTDGKLGIVAEAEHAVQQFLENHADVAAVGLGIITGVMIVAGCAGTAAFAVGFFQNCDPRASLRRGNSRAQAADAAAHNQDICFKRMFQRNHELLLELGCIHMQQHVIEGDTQAYRLFRTVEHAGVAVPAFLTVGHTRLGFGSILFKDIHGADIGACSAACA